MKLFNHVQIKVKDLTRSRKFYDIIMSVLGYRIVLDINDMLVGYGTDIYDMFEIRQYTKNHLLSKSIHLAFNASSKEKVNEFYSIALENKGTCNGKPGFRPEYEIGYYAAFIIDTDGNNIEAVHIVQK